MDEPNSKGERAPSLNRFLVIFALVISLLFSYVVIIQEYGPSLPNHEFGGLVLTYVVATAFALWYLRRIYQRWFRRAKKVYEESPDA